MYDFLLELKKVSIWGALPLFVNVIFLSLLYYTLFLFNSII